MSQIKERINHLKKEKDAVILAHYYVQNEVQEVADYVGDSYYLSKLATELEQKTIVFCGVSFMGESAKILNQDKTVLMPDAGADCPMAHMAAVDKINLVKAKYEDVAVVCYVNSTAELKAHSDVCVTSSNALKIVKALPNQRIYFIPDENLGRYIAEQVPEKEFIFNDGFCPIHAAITAEEVKKVKEKYPNAKVLVHPECKMDVLEEADYIGSTLGIINYATNSDEKEFIICTEKGVIYELMQKNPDKKFYMASESFNCNDMKKITLEKIVHVLETGDHEVMMDEIMREKAKLPLTEMLNLAK